MAKMSEWKTALDGLKADLKLNIKMHHLNDVLSTAADGFMDRNEVQAVTTERGDAAQMGKVIDILLGKESVEDFMIFCKLLRRCNYEGWAKRLESAAEEASKPQGKVLKDFTPTTDEDLPLKKGDTVFLLKTLGEEWYEGEDSSRKWGHIPASHIKVIIPLPREN